MAGVPTSVSVTGPASERPSLAPPSRVIDIDTLPPLEFRVQRITMAGREILSWKKLSVYNLVTSVLMKARDDMEQLRASHGRHENHELEFVRQFMRPVL